MRFTIRELLLTVTAICVSFGCYSLGNDNGRRAGRRHGYAEAEDHYQVMLSSYAYSPDVWEYIGDLWREYPSMTIVGTQLETEDQWRAFVQYHAQRNGWKDAGVFRRLEDRERIYAEQKRIESTSSTTTPSEASDE